MAGLTTDPRAAVVDSLAAAAREAGEFLLGLPRPPLPATMAEFRAAFGEIDDAVSGPLGERLAAIRPGATSHPPFAATEPAAVRAAGTGLAAVMPRVGAIRNLGPTSWQVADVAGGRLDGFWLFGRWPGL